MNITSISTEIIRESCAGRERCFSVLVDMIDKYWEDDDLVSRFCEELRLLNEYDLLSLSATTPGHDGQVYYLNLAAICVSHHQHRLFYLVVEKTPSLLWQRFMDETKRMITPLEVAAEARNPILFREILSYPALVAYAQVNPVEYASLIDRCQAHCKRRFTGVTQTNEETVIMRHLARVSIRTLFTEASGSVLTESCVKVYRQAFPLEPYHGAPDFVKHIDLRLALGTGELLRTGNSVRSIANAFLFATRELFCFLRNPAAYPTAKREVLIEKIPWLFLHRQELVALTATHLYVNIKSTPDAETTVLFLRFIRLDAVAAAYCA